MSDLPRVITISEGLCYKSMCAVADASIDEIEAEAGPSGTRRGWKLSEDTHFATGQTNPCPCDQEEGRLHYLLSC